METSLLTTKLNIPPARPQLVTRPHLTVRLQEGLNYNLILISAPAGFGKTTLLSEWARQSQPQMRTAWVSLDEGDNDPVRFWDYFIAALQTMQPACGENALTLLHSTRTLSGQVPPIESIMTILINDLADIPNDFIVALDDYQLIESKEIHDGITYLFEHMPAHMHLAIATRADPPLPLAHFRGRGTMLEIGADDLRFTIEDTVGLLREMKTPEISTEDVVALNERTEGWVVGLKMAALSMSGQKDIHRFIATFTGSQRYVMDYLMEEVLQKQTEEMRDFLLKTSLLERLSGHLCDAITRQSDGQDKLLKLDRDNLFIVPLDESRQWYRYEHLFADLLRHQMESIYGAEDVAELHRRASHWYEDNHFLDEAVEHALTAHDWDRAAHLIKTTRKFESGNCFILLDWLQRLPTTLVESDMKLGILYCTALIYVKDLDTADTLLNHIEQSCETNDIFSQGELASLRCASAFKRRNYLAALEFGNKTLTLLPKGYGYLQTQVLGFLALIYWDQDNLKKAEELISEQYSTVLVQDSPFEISGALYLLGIFNIGYGRLNQAVDYFLKASQFGEWIEFTSRSYSFLAVIYYEWNDLEKADLYSLKAIESAKVSRCEESIVEAKYQLAYIRMAQGDEAGAMEFLEKADQSIYEAHPLWARARQATSHIRLAIQQGDVATATKWGKVPLEYPADIIGGVIHIPIRLLIARGKNSEAAKQLNVLYERMAQSEAQHLMIRYRVYQAMAAENEATALDFLADALTMAESEGYIRTFVDEGKLLKPLLEKALSKEVTPEYTRELITIIETEERQKRMREKDKLAPSPHPSILSERELEVLHLMAEGLSNQQIADRLIISLSTAKNHVHNILEKLNVQGRTQAVAQARELEFI